MKKTLLRENGLQGTLFEPGTVNQSPAIIIAPGSDGGVPELLAEKLASQNYVVLALGYFALKDLPDSLESIPLEYFERAFDWLKERQSVDSNAIGWLGYSRSAELGLLLASKFPGLINVLIAYVPSSVVCGGFPHPNQPAWTLGGNPIKAFLPGLMSKEKELTEKQDLNEATNSKKISFHANTEEDPYEIRDLFLARNQIPGILDSAAIQVENIRCPLLLISGDDDKIWPSAFYANRIMKRLSEHRSPIERKHLSYPNAGHGLTSPYDGPIFHPVGNFWCRLGGTPEGNLRACDLAWQEVLSFLGRYLR